MHECCSISLLLQKCIKLYIKLCIILIMIVVLTLKKTMFIFEFKICQYTTINYLLIIRWLIQNSYECMQCSNKVIKLF